MDWQELLTALGGGPLAVAALGLAFVIWRLMQRNDALVDRMLDMSAKQTEALNALAKQIESIARGRP